MAKIHELVQDLQARISHFLYPLKEDEGYFFHPILKNNLFVSKSHYRLLRSMQDGETDLANLVKTQKDEDVWVFDHKESLWFSSGYGQDDRTNLNGLAGTKQLGIQLSYFGNRLTHYHIHPVFYEYILEHNMKKIIKNNNIANHDIEKTASISAALSFALPSIADIKVYSVLLQNFSKGVDVDFKIAHKFGLTKISIQDHNNLRNIYQNARQSYSNDDAVWNAKHRGAAIKESIKCLNSQLKDKMYLEIEFVLPYHTFLSSKNP